MIEKVLVSGHAFQGWPPEVVRWPENDRHHQCNRILNVQVCHKINIVFGTLYDELVFTFK